VRSLHPLAPPVTIAAHPAIFIFPAPISQRRKDFFFEKKKQKTFDF
jgi:hypothetical protein